MNHFQGKKKEVMKKAGPGSRGESTYLVIWFQCTDIFSPPELGHEPILGPNQKSTKCFCLM